MRVAPGAGPQAGPSPQSQGPQAPQGPSPQEIVQAMEDSFVAMGKLLQSAGSQLPPEDLQLFKQAAQATDAFIQSITGGGQDNPEPPQAKAAPGGPMPQNASPNSQEAPSQG